MRTFTGRERVLMLGLLLITATAAWRIWPRPWHPGVELETDHYTITSSATEEQTKEIGIAVEILHHAYTDFIRQFKPCPADHPKLKVKLYKNREEFRRCTGIRGWAEAFYRAPYCYQYYSSREVNPYHWMLHEATHQLNAEVASLRLRKWMEEGLAEYFGTSRIIGKKLSLGTIDTNTYPVWWLPIMATSGHWQEDLANGSVIPLRQILTNHGGPSLDTHFNLYYLHWWSLTHFLFHYKGGLYKKGAFELIKDRAYITAFEKHIGPLEEIQPQWYAYVLHLKKTLTGRSTPPPIIRASSI